ncbi:MAG: LemA family protein [Candidatus Levybacteria bacterium]|nr:LemA family protein [Candidatus Levybacteria bacterium]MBI2421148.1 LemA family protein [Candidatus Levybacteria bacterium]
MNPLIIIAIVVGGILLYIWFLYNTLISTKLRVSEAFSHIDVQLKRRASLIPNLIETVKGYAKHEKDLLEKITQLRSEIVSNKGVEDKAKANNMLSDALKSLFAVAENYPQLRASENFKELQGELSDTENKIAYARQFYNSQVLDYNTKLAIFPNVFIARILNLAPAEFFAASEEEKKEVKVSF